MARRGRAAEDVASRALSGAYPGPRAAALAGVPKSTVYYWARKKVVVPSVSHSKEMLWSYADLIGLRLVHWLRQSKAIDAEIVRATPMKQVRAALAALAERGIDLWQLSTPSRTGSPLLVDRRGHIFLESDRSISDLSGQSAMSRDFCRLLDPFAVGEIQGPSLIAPRPLLRIVPGKLSGEPHVLDSRLSTHVIGALSDRGMAVGVIAQLYPGISAKAIEQAIDLERQLMLNGAIAA